MTLNHVMESFNNENSWKILFGIELELSNWINNHYLFVVFIHLYIRLIKVVRIEDQIFHHLVIELHCLYLFASLVIERTCPHTCLESSSMKKYHKKSWQLKWISKSLSLFSKLCNSDEILEATSEKRCVPIHLSLLTFFENLLFPYLLRLS